MGPHDVRDKGLLPTYRYFTADVLYMAPIRKRVLYKPPLRVYMDPMRVYSNMGPLEGIYKHGAP